jgi:hypothetical protein
MGTMTTRNVLFLIVWVVLGSTFWGCSSTAFPPGSTLARTTSDGTPQVTVSVDASGIAQERLQVFEERGGAEALANGILKELAETKKQPAPAPAELRVVVTNFRLRSTGSGFWLGAMAGADKLDVDVTLVSEGEVLKTYQTGVAGVVAGLIKPGAGKRFNGLIEVASERIVQEL